MNDWTAGYVADIGYTYGYYRELNPLHAREAFHLAGHVFPQVRTACELGFGQGLSSNIHAAASNVEWYGTDFNPAQAAFARELAQASGAPVTLYDDAFADFVARDDLPDFDFIGLHGIWSWISDDNRKTIVDFVRRKLTVGGVLYISYNTLPGWSGFAPMRHLMSEHAMRHGGSGTGILNRVDQAVGFADELLKTNPSYARINPILGERMNKLKEQDRHYLAHEYFNRDWQPMYFSEMGDWLRDAKLDYVGSGAILEHIDVVNLTPDQQKFMASIGDRMFREGVRDYMVNQQFRRDYWVKGARPVTPLAKTEIVRNTRVQLTSHRPLVSLTVKGALGEANMAEAVYNPILDYLADHRPHTVFDIEKALQAQSVPLPQIVQAMAVLMGGGHIYAVQDEQLTKKCRPQTDRLNGEIMKRARSSAEIAFLASPVTGGGFAVGRFEQLFLLAARNGGKQPDDWARFAWNLLAAQGQRLIQDGKTLEEPDANLAELKRMAHLFQERQLPILKSLGIA